MELRLFMAFIVYFGNQIGNRKFWRPPRRVRSPYLAERGCVRNTRRSMPPANIASKLPRADRKKKLNCRKPSLRPQFIADTWARKSKRKVHFPTSGLKADESPPFAERIEDRMSKVEPRQLWHDCLAIWMAPGLDPSGCEPAKRRSRIALLHRDALGEVAGLVDVAAAGDGDVIGEELQGNTRENRDQRLRRRRQVNHVVRHILDLRVAFGRDRDDRTLPRPD